MMTYNKRRLPMQASNAEIQGVPKFALIQMSSAMMDVVAGRQVELQALPEKLMLTSTEAVEFKLPVLALALPPKRFDAGYQTKWGCKSAASGKLALVRLCLVEYLKDYGAFGSRAFSERLLIG